MGRSEAGRQKDRFGDLLRRYRLAAELTQEELAERAQISARAVSDIERGVYRAPRRVTLQLLEDALSLSDSDRAALEATVVRTRRASSPPGIISIADAHSRSTRQYGCEAVDSPAHLQALASWEADRSNLPVQPTRFIGRRCELAAVKEMLLRPEVRLLTLTGPGGVGKTRLAVEAARELLSHFPDGVRFVSLASVADPGLVAATMARALDLPEVGNRPLQETLKSYLRTKRVLLVLDNFEHLLESACLLGDLLAACPTVKILVTSRALLRLAAEQVYAVPPLSLPDPGQALGLEALVRYDAVALFIQRAQAVRADFTVHDDTAPAVAEVCRRLDGLPLPIELAAARIRLFPPQTLLNQLSRRLNLLTGGARDKPARHQTLRGAIDWSYTLLPSHEQTMFVRLSVFAGGSTVEAVEAVCNADGELDVVEALAGLVDKSLVQQTEVDGEARFGMLETIREYALEQLDLAGQGDWVRARHAEYFASLAAQTEEALRGPDQARMLQRFTAEHENFRSVLSWALEGGRTDLLVEMAGDLRFYWWVRGSLSEARMWLDAALSHRDGARPEALANVLSGAGNIAVSIGDYRAARGWHEECLAVRRALRDESGVATSLLNLGAVAQYEGDLERAITLFQESLPVFERTGNALSQAIVLLNLGEVMEQRGECERAQTFAERSMQLFAARDDPRGVAICLVLSAVLTERRRDYDRAQALLGQALLTFQEVGGGEYWIDALEASAALAGVQGRAEKGAQLLGAADAIGETMGFSLNCRQRARHERFCARLRAQLGDQAFQRGWHAGRAMTLEQAIAHALNESPGA